MDASWPSGLGSSRCYDACPQRFHLGFKLLIAELKAMHPCAHRRQDLAILHVGVVTAAAQPTTKRKTDRSKRDERSRYCNNHTRVSITEY